MATREKGSFVAEIRERRKPTLAYPAVGESFELTLDGGAPENQPIEMVMRDGYGNGWKHKGPTVKGRQTRTFKLVQVGHCRNFDEARHKLGSHGKIPEGQWRNAFKAAYPITDGNEPIGVADPSWEDLLGGANFPVVRSRGPSRFLWVGYSHCVDWRWLIEVEGK